MVFSSLVFVCVFLPVLLLLYYLVPFAKVRNGLLIAGSLLFYAYGEPVYVFLMIGSVFCNYLLGIWLGRHPRKGLLFLAVGLNLGLLGVFKYADMAVLSLNQMFQWQLSTPDIPLPIGISFFTFQILSYDIDVYRGEVKPQKNFLQLLLYVSFFPQLIAGPIVKYRDVSEQIEKRTLSVEQTAAGFRRFIVGLSKKVLISNTLALLADQLFAWETSRLGIFTAWLAMISYLLQIYFDFSGYSDMAIGMAQLFGFRLKENFHYPYIAQTIQDFWKRWHISLSSWFRDYLYIPLGGNRKGKVRTCLNKLAVFFCTGLWHGASWTFVVWGLYHGFFLLLEEVLPIKKLPKVLGHLYTILVVGIGFVIFRADTLLQGLQIIGRMFSAGDLTLAAANVLPFCTPLNFFTLGLGILCSLPWKEWADVWMEKRPDLRGGFLSGASYVISWCLLVLCLLNLSGGTYNPFIYFRF